MQIEELIKNKKLKLTPARKLLLEIFSKTLQPLAYEDIKSEISMDKATFYRNMTTFEELGILNGFESNNKKRYYEMSETLHSHFICSLCHKIECLNEENSFSLKGYKVENVIVHGVCMKCN